jgi:hypothetical protein
MARGRTFSRQDLLGVLYRAHRSRSETAQRLDRLLADGILTLGLELQCIFCGQRSWYSLAQLDTSLVCSHCMRQYEFPSADPPRDAWHYRSVGPFSIPDFAKGSFTVALALRFLAMLGHGDICFAPPFLLKTHAHRELESDLGAFLQPDILGRQCPFLILGECKSFNRFEQGDIARLSRLARAFPGATLLLCTLRDKLEPPEKQAIGKLALGGRRSLQADTWRNPVVVLTATELLSEMGIPSSWQRKGGRAARLAEQYSSMRAQLPNLQGLADITQQLHLDLEDYYSWLEADIKRRLSRRKRGRRGISRRKKALKDGSLA